jgi:predicted nucleotidyltransferase
MSNLLSALQQQKSRIIDIASQYHAENIRVFGSVVRGEEDDESDIDFLVDFLPGSTLVEQVGLINELSTALGRKVDVVSERALNKYLKQQVLQEAVSL